MVVLKNVNYSQFLSEASGKRIVCFGAGGTLRDFLRCNQGKINLLERVDFILDNNPDKKGDIIEFNSKRISVISLDEFINSDFSCSNIIFILTVANEHLINIIYQLDNEPRLDNIACYIGMTAMKWGREIYPPTDSVLPVRQKVYSIPRIIHYCWFGKNNISHTEQNCIDSWKQHCPDYEIKLWTEDNYSISEKPLYVKQAYNAGKYAFVSDYVRLDIIYNYGGIYMDTDVELLASLDKLLGYKAFFGFESLNMINTGLGFGSISKNPVLKELIDLYNRTRFTYNSGEINITSCPEYHTEYFRSNYLKINNSMQIIDDMLFLPGDYLCPFNQGSMLYEFTDNTISDHLFNISWVDKDLRKDRHDEIRQFEAINKRLKADWINCERNAN